ncbi:peptide chain release factor 1 [Lentinus tigrinus ALCF2SS1-7]|uniref:Peptide chain release factor 1 n=1 Tax=Lentinus tigrinus ALCF2SS1-6 TaxID=1328759 RepID=A0A5C2SDS8_9APHY|nr:peptide chain release factor 1 [Lentinus tigrinus ALCF2SS1-6]RPD74461.1 peptide chain release factor 1 [Lentinus tigrinus ALCF2SS1-7]
MFRPALRQLRLSRAFTTTRTALAQVQAQRQATYALKVEDAPIVQYVKRRVEERRKLQSEISDDALSDEDIQKVRKIRELEPLQDAWTEWKHAKESLEETLPLLNDPDPTMRSMAEEEYASLSDNMTQMVENTFPSLLVPPSDTAHLSAIIELRAGVGGSESALFTADLVRMYTRTAQSQGWTATMLGSNVLETGGMRDAIMEVKGEGAYDALRWESGVHRVQRVPATETNGRVHTSTVSAMVLPLLEEKGSNNEDDDLFTMDEVKVEVMRSRGAGGQHVNKTESAVRLTHIPTGITVSMQDERSQHQNKRRAFQVLRARLMDRKLNQEMIDRRDLRRSLVRSADRSEKIRTYNYAQDRVTDHRLGMSVKNLDSVMEGDGLQDFLKALQQRHHDELLEDVLSERS